MIDFWLDLRCAEYEKELISVPLAEILQYHCGFLKKYTRELIILHQNGLHPRIEKKFSVFLPDTMPLWSEDSVEQAYRSQYIIAGIEDIVRVWVTREFRKVLRKSWKL